MVIQFKSYILLHRFLTEYFSHPKCYACRDFGWQQRYARFCGRVVVISILALILYPFLWAWTIIGTLWFSSAKNCVCVFFFFGLLFWGIFIEKLMVCDPNNYLQLPEEGQKWAFLIWLLFSYCGLLCLAFVALGKVISMLLLF